MTLRSRDLHSESDLDSIRNSCDVIVNRYQDLSPFMTLSSISELFLSVFTGMSQRSTILSTFLIWDSCRSRTPRTTLLRYFERMVIWISPSQLNLFEPLNQKAANTFSFGFVVGMQATPKNSQLYLIKREGGEKRERSPPLPKITRPSYPLFGNS